MLAEVVAGTRRARQGLGLVALTALQTVVMVRATRQNDAV